MSPVERAIDVEHGDQRVLVSAEREVSFGRNRTSTIRLDRHRADPTLSRTTGVFLHLGDGWRVQVLTTSPDVHLSVVAAGGTVDLPVRVAGPIDPPSMRLPPAGTVVVRTPRSEYHVRFATPGATPAVRAPFDEQTPTQRPTQVRLAPGELRVCIALCQPRLSGDRRTPTSRELAGELGSTRRAVDKTIERITRKLRDVPSLGIRADGNVGTTHNRTAIVDWATTTGPDGHGPITEADLRT